MLDEGFEPAIGELLAHPDMPDKTCRQTLMFSATFPDDVQRFARTFMRDSYTFVSVGEVGAANSCIEQKFIMVRLYLRILL